MFATLLFLKRFKCCHTLEMIYLYSIEETARRNFYANCFTDKRTINVTRCNDREFGVRRFFMVKFILNFARLSITFMEGLKMYIKFRILFKILSAFSFKYTRLLSFPMRFYKRIAAIHVAQVEYSYILSKKEIRS